MAIPGLGFLPADFDSKYEERRLAEAQSTASFERDASDAIELHTNIHPNERSMDQPDRSLPLSNPPKGDEAHEPQLSTRLPCYDEKKLNVDDSVSQSVNTHGLSKDFSPEEEIIDLRVTNCEKDSGGGSVVEMSGQVPLPQTNQHNAEGAEYSFDSSDDDSSNTSSEPESSEDSTSGQDDDDMSIDEDYELLDPAEQARILMKGDTDDDFGGKNANTAPKTANERSEDVIQRPDVIITEENEIQELGVIETIVENFALVKATFSLQTKVLGSGSPLCLEDRTVIGSVAEPIGRVDNPHYSVAFNNASEMAELGIYKGRKIMYPPEFAEYVFTQPLKLLKGSDASNMHDEEVGHEEVEFSDDEAEAAYKRQKKLDRQARKVNSGFGGVSMSHREATGSSVHGQSADRYEVLKYVKEEDDDLYTPLARPPGLYGDGEIPPPLPRNLGVSSRGSVSESFRGRGRGNHKSKERRGRRQISGKQFRDHPDAPSNFPNISAASSSTQRPARPHLHGPTMLHESDSINVLPSPFPQTQHTNDDISFGRPFSVSGVPPGAFLNPAFFQSQQTAMRTDHSSHAIPPASDPVAATSANPYMYNAPPSTEWNTG